MSNDAERDDCLHLRVWKISNGWLVGAGANAERQYCETHLEVLEVASGMLTSGMHKCILGRKRKKDDK